MINISQKEQMMLDLFLRNSQLSSSEVHQKLLDLGEEMSLVTVKRDLSSMVDSGLLTPLGHGRSRAYSISIPGRVFSEVNANEYSEVEPDDRYGLSGFNFDLFRSFPSDIFTTEELLNLENATRKYHDRTANLPPAIQKKELERFIIELSWKSSKIEGNTYTLLDTEKLILEHKEAPGHDKKEAAMILNHKEAFNFAHDNRNEFKKVSLANLEYLHSVIVKDLNIGLGFRQKPVGITGSKYRPLDNSHQIKEAVETLVTLINKIDSPF